MNKIKLLSIVALLLFISNVVLVFFLVQKPKPHEGPKNIIIQKLNFDVQQVSAYEKLIIQHRKAIRQKEQQIRRIKRRLYTSLNQNREFPRKTRMIERLGQKQIEIETIHYEHFKDIKKICKPEQIARFNALTKELTRLFDHKPRPKRRN
jgi:protein CpxP